MMRWIFLALVGILVIGGGTMVASGSSADEGEEATGQDLVGASPETIAQMALQYTKDRVIIKSGQPTVLLSRAVALEDMKNFGLSMGNFAPDCNRPFHLVIIKGDFDLRNTLPSSGQSTSKPANFIAYTYDLKAGVLTRITADRTGAMFKKALGDPTLPDLPTPAPRPNGEPGNGVSYAPPGPPIQEQYIPCEPTVAHGTAEPRSR